MKIQKTVFLIAVSIFSNVTFAGHHDHHHGRRGGHRHHCDCASTTDEASKTYRIKVLGQDYKLILITDSTVKVNETVYPLKSIGHSTDLVNWTSKDGTVLSNVIDWHRGKMYTTQLSADKKASIITSDIIEEKAPVVPATNTNDSKPSEPVKKN